MKSKWQLLIKTSLPYVCKGAEDLKEESFTFESFESARRILRNKLKEYAYSENSMFDGKGNMIYLKKCLDNAWVPNDDDIMYEDHLTKTVFAEIYNSYKEIFKGKDTDISGYLPFYTDYSMVIRFKNGMMTIGGDDEGLLNGINPKFSTNMFDMSEEKDYFLYVDDYFGFLEQDISSELYIDLKKVDIE